MSLPYVTMNLFPKLAYIIAQEINKQINKR